MRFMCLYKPGKPESGAPPDPNERAAMENLIDEMSKAGVLLATAGCAPSSKSARVRIDSGKYTVVDGPFPKAEELIAGYCLMQVKSKAEAIEWGKRFLAVAGVGQTEILQIAGMSDFAP